jgi:hypothetical protein
MIVLPLWFKWYVVLPSSPPPSLRVVLLDYCRFFCRLSITNNMSYIFYLKEYSSVLRLPLASDSSKIKVLLNIKQNKTKQNKTKQNKSSILFLLFNYYSMEFDELLCLLNPCCEDDGHLPSLQHGFDDINALINELEPQTSIHTYLSSSLPLSPLSQIASIPSLILSFLSNYKRGINTVHAQ